MSVAENLPLANLDGKYALHGILGEGATGTIYEAEHLVVGKRVAIKLMNRAAFAKPGARDRFVAEARAAARVSHANVVDIYDFGVTGDGVPYLVLELLHGETLEEILSARGPLAASYACELMLQVLAGLTAAHAQGVIHCDLKPANVMVTHPRPDRPLVKLLDFGIARNLADVERAEAKTTGGTPMYMAPEQALGETLTPRTDLYAAAAILYAMLTGKDAYRGSTAREVLNQVVRGAFVPLLESNPRVPAALAGLVEAGLSRDPSQRPASAQAFSDAIRPFLSPELASSLGPRVAGLGVDAIPLVTVPREITIHSPKPPAQSSLEAPVSESSVVPIQFANPSRGVTDSLLMSPRIPRAASTPKLRVGKDFMPQPGDPGWDDVRERRAQTSVPRYRRARRNLLPALLATGIGFALGVLIAWLSGAI